MTGYDLPDPELNALIEIVYPNDSSSEIEIPGALKDKPGDAHEKSIIYLFGPQGSGKQEIALALCRESKKPLLLVHTYSLFHQETPIHRLFRLIQREAVLLGCVVYFIQVDFLFESIEDTSLEKSVFFNALKIMKRPLFFSTEKQFTFNEELQCDGLFSFGFSVHGYAERKRIWKQCFDEKKIDSGNPDFNILANSFRFTKGRIKTAVAEALHRAKTLQKDTIIITMNDLIAACRNHSSRMPCTLAKKIDPVYQWNDIILPDDQLQQLKEMTGCVQYRNIVYEEWGFEKKHASCMRISLGLRFGKGRKGERIARKFLIQHGFSILAEQLSHRAVIFINGKGFTYDVRVDFLVKKGKRKGIVEVKTGAAAADPLSIPTRRQLFEYYHLFDVDVLYFFNAGNRTLKEIEFRVRFASATISIAEKSGIFSRKPGPVIIRHFTGICL